MASLFTNPNVRVGVRSGLPEPRAAAQHGAKQHRFDPYTMNGGTTLAIAGDDFAVIAADTRLSEGYEIFTRDCTKIFKLTDKTALASGGFHGDILTLQKHLQWQLRTYKYQHDKDMSTNAAAQLLSTMLYGRRFFPYYTINIIAGLDEQGRGAVYSYDPVGSFEREAYRAGGTGSALLQPLLDSEVGQKNKADPAKLALTKEAAINIVKDAFAGAAERDIYTGDQVEIVVITKDGMQTEYFPLRRD